MTTLSLAPLTRHLPAVSMPPITPKKLSSQGCCLTIKESRPYGR
jgi:hypothetical protein